MDTVIYEVLGTVGTEKAHRLMELLLCYTAMHPETLDEFGELPTGEEETECISTN